MWHKNQRRDKKPVQAIPTRWKKLCTWRCKLQRSLRSKAWENFMRALQYVKRTERADTAIKSFMNMTSAGQRVNNASKLPGVLEYCYEKLGTNHNAYRTNWACKSKWVRSCKKSETDAKLIDVSEICQTKIQRNWLFFTEWFSAKFPREIFAKSADFSANLPCKSSEI